MNRDFKGIWIPKEIWLNKDLKIMEKLFLVEIDSLDNSDGCYASNKYFADFFGITKGRCSQVISSLSEKNIVTIELIRQGQEVVKRIIRVVNKLNNPSKFTKQPYLENDQYNNTKGNNTKSSKRNNISKWYNSEIDFFNEVMKYKNDYSKDMLDKFILYYIEPNKKGDMKVNTFKTWSLKGRLTTWKNNNFNKSDNKKQLKRFEYDEGDENAVL